MPRAHENPKCACGECIGYDEAMSDLRAGTTIDLETIRQEPWGDCYYGEDDPLTHALPCGYDDAIVEDFFLVLRDLRDCRPAWCESIADKWCLDKKYVHLMLEVLASEDFTEYGTSPRGSWLTDSGERLLVYAEQWRANAK